MSDGLWVTVTERLCLTEDKCRVVPEDSPEARWLWAIPGAKVSRAEAERLGVCGALPPEDEKPSLPAPRRKPGRPPGSKNRLPSENKQAGDG